jgi:1,4-dihydroxy-2-naphthoate octaprenyltransferase
VATLAQWVEGARPRTLPTALSPVIAGTGAAIGNGVVAPGMALLALIVAVSLMIGVNYANDYSDGIRGTDDERVGPVRLVGSNLATPSTVRAAAFVAFAVAGLAGLTLISLSQQWWLIAVGAACIAAAWFYTGGKHPYGYRALGELAVFAFFGVAAVAGTAFVEMRRVSWLALAAAIPVGLLACALLVVNNLRDIPADAVAGKRTLAVVLGDTRTRWLYVACLALPFGAAAAIAPAAPLVLMALVMIPVAVRLARQVLSGAAGRQLISALGHTGQLQLAFGVLLAAGLAISR